MFVMHMKGFPFDFFKYPIYPILQTSQDLWTLQKTVVSEINRCKKQRASSM